MTRYTSAVLVLCTLVSSAGALKTAASSALQQDLAVSLKERPVMKVVRMLQDMKSELTTEMEDDKAVMEELTCWCETNEKEKTEALELGSAKSKALSASIDEYAGKIAELKAKRAATLDDLNKDIAALEQARELRMEESKEFQESETGLLDAIAAAQNAIVALSKHHSADFAQLRSAAHILLKAHTLKSFKALSKDNAAVLDSFLHGAESATSFLSIPGYQSYAPQSGQIFGILGQMKEDFQADLSAEQKAEAKSQEEFAALKKAKEAEIAQGKEMMISIDAQLADFGEKKADAEKELADTDAQFALDTEFLKNLKAKCSQTDAEFDARMKDRLTEIAAVDDTIKILNSDESFDAFEKMAAAVFFQRSASSSQKEQVLRRKAVSVLQHAADKVQNPRLALIAVSAQLDEFTKVKALIDDLVKELEKQQKEEAEQKDVCNADFFENKKETEAAYDKKDSLLAKEADLTKTIEVLTKDIKTATEANAELMKQMKAASETREAENADFQTTVSDHRLMAIILQKALDRMKQVYLLLQERAGQPGAPHIETSATHTDPGNGPAKFKQYEENAGGNRVVTMLETILADVKKTEVDAIVAEGDAQSAYEKFMKDSNTSVLQTLASLTHMKGVLAKSKEELISTKEDLKQTVDKLEDLSKENGDLHSMCDYLLNNFDVRQKARAAEMEALGEAKAILSGSE